MGFDRNTTPGKAKVVTIDLSRHGDSHTDWRGRQTSRYDVVLDVYPEGGAAAFRAETHQQFSPLRFPNPGEELAVKCNPKKGTVAIDLDGDARYNPDIFRRENDLRAKAEHDQVMNAAPGTTPPTWIQPTGDPEIDELARADAEKRSRRIAEGRKFGDDGELLR